LPRTYVLEKNRAQIIHPSPQDLSVLIECVVLAPGATSKDAEGIRDILNKCGVKKIPVESSRSDRELTD